MPKVRGGAGVLSQDSKGVCLPEVWTQVEEVMSRSLLSQAVIEGDWDEAARLTVRVLDSGASPQDVITQELHPAMGVVGEKFSSGEYFLPDMLKAGRAMNSALAVLQPLLANTDIASVGKVVIGTVEGDIHDIGKYMVVMFLKGVGFEVSDLGANVPEERFVGAVREMRPDILGLSSLLTTTMPAMGRVIKALDVTGLRSSVKVIVGGAPITQDYADSISADAYGHDAGQAARVCKELIKR